MANISSAYGTMTLVGGWEREHIAALNRIADELWRRWHYDIDVFDEFTAENLSSSFSGNGRWTFESNLESIGRWSDGCFADGYSGLHAVYKTLAADMEANGLSVDVAFSDEESGCRVLYTQEGAISARGGSLVYEKRAEEHFEYNWRNVIDLAGEDDVFDELIAALAEEAGMPKDDTGEIEAWALENTEPHSFGFDCLSDEQRTDFKNRFCRQQ
jgi:hypothetical protein